MNGYYAVLLASCAAIAVSAGSGEARAQHVDVLTLQVDGQLVTGKSDCGNDPTCSTTVLTLGKRVFPREFDTDFLVNNPGFNSPASTSPALPPGSQALPPSSQLNWDFMPMQIGDMTSDLIYWNGSDTDGQPGITKDDVVFGALPGPNYALTMFDVNSHPYTVHGADQSIVPGGRVATTLSTGFIHVHNYFLLDDGSGYLGTPPADGIYLWAVRVRMTGLRTSRPFVFAFGTNPTGGTSGTSPEVEDAATAWLEQQLSLTGDYNGNGMVDTADYTVWRDTLGEMGGMGSFLPADGSGNTKIDDADYNVWKMNFGQMAELRFGSGAGAGSEFNGNGVPEPSAVALVLIALVALPVMCSRLLPMRRGLGSAPPRR